MATPQYHFVQSLPIGMSDKDFQIGQSKARSHAAKFGVQRRKEVIKFEPGKSSTPAIAPKFGNLVHRWSGSRPIRMSHQSRHGGTLDNKNSATRQSRAAFSDYSCSPGLRIDPFYSMHHSRDKFIAKAIDFFTQRIMPRNNLLSQTFNITNISEYLLQTLSVNHRIFHAGIAAVYFVSEQVPGLPLRPSQRVLFHRSLALSAMREDLKRSDVLSDPTTQCEMMLLAILDRMLQDESAFGMHRHGITSSMSSRGGLRKLENKSLEKGLIMQYDFFWAVTTGKTMFPNERHTLSQIDDETHSFSSVEPHLLTSNLPPGFEVLATQNSISSNTLGVLYRFVDASISFNQNHESSTLNQPPRLTRHNDFWEACPCLVESDVHPLSLDKLVLLAIILRIYATFDLPPVVMQAFLTSRTELTRRVFAYYPVTKAEQECVIWAAVTAIEAWHYPTPASSDDAFFLINELRNRAPDVVNPEFLMSTMRKFFWKPCCVNVDEVHQLITGVASREVSEQLSIDSS